MDKDYYCKILVMKHHLNTTICQMVNSDSDKRVFNNLKFLIKTPILLNEELIEVYFK